MELWPLEAVEKKNSTEFLKWAIFVLSLGEEIQSKLLSSVKDEITLFIVYAMGVTVQWYSEWY